MSEKTNEIKMGQKVKDRITGFTGRVTALCTYITGCDQACVTTPADKDGSTKTSWPDVSRLKILEEPTEDLQSLIDGKNDDGSDVEKNGGPQDHPSKC